MGDGATPQPRSTCRNAQLHDWPRQVAPGKGRETPTGERSGSTEAAACDLSTSCTPCCHPPPGPSPHYPQALRSMPLPDAARLTWIVVTAASTASLKSLTACRAALVSALDSRAAAVPWRPKTWDATTCQADDSAEPSAVPWQPGALRECAVSRRAAPLVVHAAGASPPPPAGGERGVGVAVGRDMLILGCRSR